MKKKDFKYIEVTIHLVNGNSKYRSIPNHFPYFFSKLATEMIGYLVLGQLSSVEFNYCFSNEKVSKT